MQHNNNDKPVCRVHRHLPAACGIRCHHVSVRNVRCGMERRSAIEMMTDLLNTVRARCPRSADAILPFLQELNDHVKEQDLIIIQLAMMPRVSMPWTAAPENLNVLKN